MIAVTPRPPAAQIEITPLPEPLSASSLASVATIRPPVAPNGWPAAERAAMDVEPFAVDRAERLVEPEPLAAEDRVLPGLERAQDLGGERLMDLVEVELLQRHPGPREHLRHRVGRRHQQSFALVDVVDGRCLRAREVGQHGDLVRGRPLLAGEQHRRGAVGQRRRVAGRHRPVRAAEHRLELG